MKNKLYIKITEASNYIKKLIKNQPKIGLILGSGLGVLGGEIQEKIEIDYKDIPHFPKSTVEGHEGKLIIGKIEDKDVIAMQGRFHYYEGYTMQQVAFPVWVMKILGIEKLIVTNAAGGINTDFSGGDLMIIKDHINFFGDNPLIGENLEQFGPRFKDMTNPYSLDMISIAKECFRNHDIKINEGIYIGMSGPAYETPAEIRAARVLGADAVGMSTVPEVVAANHAGIEVLGISCITNMAAGVLDKSLSHEEVVSTAESVREKFILLIKSIIRNLIV